MTTDAAPTYVRRGQPLRHEDIDPRSPLAIALYAWQQRKYWRDHLNALKVGSPGRAAYASGHVAAFSDLLDLILETRDERRIVDDHLQPAFPHLFIDPSKT